MSVYERLSVTLTTASTGAAGATTALTNGEIREVIWTNSTGAAHVAGAALTLVSSITSLPILTAVSASASFVKAPRQLIHTASGGAANVATGNFYDRISVANEKIICTVTSTGASKVGSLTIVVG